MGKIGSIEDMRNFQYKLAQYDKSQLNIIKHAYIFKDLPIITPKKRYNFNSITHNYNTKNKSLNILQNYDRYILT